MCKCNNVQICKCVDVEMTNDQSIMSKPQTLNSKL